jgi:hypothetical protein
MLWRQRLHNKFRIAFVPETWLPDLRKAKSCKILAKISKTHLAAKMSKKRIVFLASK